MRGRNRKLVAIFVNIIVVVLIAVVTRALIGFLVSQPFNVTVTPILAGEGSAIAGNIVISDAYVWATALNLDATATPDPMAGMAGMPASNSIHPSSIYLTIHNTSTQPDTLIGMSAAAVGSVMLHQTTVTNNIAQMQMISQLDIPAGGVVRFAPGGLHLMLDDLKHDLVAGSTITLTLKFASGAIVTVAVPVRSP